MNTNTYDRPTFYGGMVVSIVSGMSYNDYIALFTADQLNCQRALEREFEKQYGLRADQMWLMGWAILPCGCGGQGCVGWGLSVIPHEYPGPWEIEYRMGETSALVNIIDHTVG